MSITLWRSFLCHSFIIACFAFLVTRNLAAAPSESVEFLETGPGVFQSTSLRERVIVSYGDRPGIFILSTVPTGIQEFDLASLEKSAARHVFIEYDPASNRYTNLIIGNTYYRISGNFTVEMSRIRISVDNINPYLTVAVSHDKTILGFKGLQSIVKAAGEAALTFLEANQLDEYSELIVPYSLKKEKGEQVLQLKGQKVMSSNIGLSLTAPRNLCLVGKNIVYLTEQDVAKTRTMRAASERLKYLDTAFKENAKKNLLADTLTLKVTKDSIVYFDFNQLKIKRVSPMKNRFSGNTVCVINDFALQ